MAATDGAGTSIEVDVIHLSDLQIGARCRFPATSAASDLRAALVDDFGRLVQQGHLEPGRPRIIAVTGDIADSATRREYEQARDLLRSLGEELGVAPSRIVVVPGNHDVSWLKSRFYFAECKQDKVPAVAPYYPKLE